VLFLRFSFILYVVLCQGLVVIQYNIGAIHDSAISFQFVLTFLLGYVAVILFPSLRCTVYTYWWAFKSYLFLVTIWKRLPEDGSKCGPKYITTIK
jgi:hypothetical protein